MRSPGRWQLPRAVQQRPPRAAARSEVLPFEHEDRHHGKQDRVHGDEDERGGQLVERELVRVQLGSQQVGAEPWKDHEEARDYQQAEGGQGAAGGVHEDGRQEQRQQADGHQAERGDRVSPEHLAAGRRGGSDALPREAPGTETGAPYERTEAEEQTRDDGYGKHEENDEERHQRRDQNLGQQPLRTAYRPQERRPERAERDLGAQQLGRDDRDQQREQKLHAGQQA